MRITIMFFFLLGLAACDQSSTTSGSLSSVEQGVSGPVLENSGNTRVAQVACAELRETRVFQSLERVRIVNEAREKIGGEPYLEGDDLIVSEVESGECERLILETREERMARLTATRLEREEIAQRAKNKALLEEGLPGLEESVSANRERLSNAAGQAGSPDEAKLSWTELSPQIVNVPDSRKVVKVVFALGCSESVKPEVEKAAKDYVFTGDLIRALRAISVDQWVSETKREIAFDELRTALNNSLTTYTGVNETIIELVVVSFDII